MRWVFLRNLATDQKKEMEIVGLIEEQTNILVDFKVIQMEAGAFWYIKKSTIEPLAWKTRNAAERALTVDVYFGSHYTGGTFLKEEWELFSRGIETETAWNTKSENHSSLINEMELTEAKYNLL